MYTANLCEKNLEPIHTIRLERVRRFLNLYKFKLLDESKNRILDNCMNRSGDLFLLIAGRYGTVSIKRSIKRYCGQFIEFYRRKGNISFPIYQICTIEVFVFWMRNADGRFSKLVCFVVQQLTQVKMQSVVAIFQSKRSATHRDDDKTKINFARPKTGSQCRPHADSRFRASVSPIIMYRWRPLLPQ